MTSPPQPSLTGWMATGTHSWCPACGDPDVWVRFVSSAGWEYECRACGDSGECGIRDSASAWYGEEAT